jgi:hypothetical protein
MTTTRKFQPLADPTISVVRCQRGVARRAVALQAVRIAVVQARAAKPPPVAKLQQAVRLVLVARPTLAMRVELWRVTQGRLSMVVPLATRVTSPLLARRDTQELQAMQGALATQELRVLLASFLVLAA